MTATFVSDTIHSVRKSILIDYQTDERKVSIMTIKTNLPAGEYSASVLSMKDQNQEGQHIFSLVLATETGEQVTVSTKLNAFGIHESKQLLNNLIDDFNLLIVEGMKDYTGEEVLPIMPINDVNCGCSICHYFFVIDLLEGLLKEFEAVLKIRITDHVNQFNGVESKRFEYLDMEKISG